MMHRAVLTLALAVGDDCDAAQSTRRRVCTEARCCSLAGDLWWLAPTFSRGERSRRSESGA
jgi:hypothetical protein